jgi:DNA-binding LytR/AlgR family response regulator
VLLEVRLHESDAGVQVAQYLRTKAVPIVLVTGYDRLARDPRLQHLPYLSEPPLPSDLVKQAAAAFGARRQRDQPK